MKVNTIACLGILAVILIGCTYNKAQTDKVASEVLAESVNGRDSVVSIEARYFNYTFTRKAMYTWDMVQGDTPDLTLTKPIGVLKNKITDPKAIEQIHQQIEILQPTDTNYIPDNRIAVTIRYKSGKEDRLAISHTYADRIYLNDTLQKTNNRLLYLIKNNIGYYTWMIGDDLLEMNELKDKSFVKEPFIRDHYYKEWESKHK